MRLTMPRMLQAPDSSLAQKITETVMEFPGVSGTYDLVLHDYGPDVYQGSLHIEVPDVYTADEIMDTEYSDVVTEKSLYD